MKNIPILRRYPLGPLYHILTQNVVSILIDIPEALMMMGVIQFD